MAMATVARRVSAALAAKGGRNFCEEVNWKEHYMRIFGDKLGRAMFKTEEEFEDAYFYGTLQFLMARMSTATQYHLDKACKQADVDVEALLHTLGQPFDKSPKSPVVVFRYKCERPESLLRCVHYSDFNEVLVVDPGATKVTSPPKIEGDLLEFLQPKKGGELLSYLRVLRPLRPPRIIWSAFKFGQDLARYVEYQFFRDNQELIEVARCLSDLDRQEGVGLAHHFFKMVRCVPPFEDIPDVTFLTDDSGRLFYREIMNYVFPMAEKFVERAEEEDSAHMVPLFNYELQHIKPIVEKKLEESTSDMGTEGDSQTFHLLTPFNHPIRPET